MLVPLLLNLAMLGDSEIIVVPPAVVDPGTPITNPNAIEIASEYWICDRTGFRVRAGQLRKEWTGAMVRPQSWESRHPQDFVRARPEHHKGSARPEPSDSFVDVTFTTYTDPSIPPVSPPSDETFFILAENSVALLAENGMHLLIESAP